MEKKNTKSLSYRLQFLDSGRLMSSLLIIFNPKMPGGRGRSPVFFVTFNIILKHIFPENFIEISQVVQKV